MTRFRKAPTATPALALFAALIAGSLTACGGGATTSASSTDMAAAADTSTASNLGSTTPADMTAATSPAPSTAAVSTAVDAEIAQSSASPTFHMAPAVLPEPTLVDVGGTNASAHVAPHKFDVDASLSGISTRGLTPQVLAQHIADNARAHVASVQATGSAGAAATRVLTGAVYTPAQIRAAYGLPDLPAAGAAISAAVAATLGAGQTIYLIDAHHDATALSDLNAFSTRFGLPACASTAIATTATLPLATPPSSCTFSVVYATSSSTMTATAPTYDSGWAPESKLDVQWAHAIAPLARIVLVETVDSMTNNLLGGIGLANRMGAGVVSMSFGLNDPGWAATEDSKFTTPGMTYLAATGDIGGQVQWPAVSPNVLAVGGTGMDWSGSGTRYEQAWLKGGGGVSAYEALPAWQAGVTPVGGTALTRRAVSDVSFNANPMTGQYVALTLPGAATVWYAYGGTSISSPQWAGIVAIANAIRASSAKPALGDIHSLIYKTIAAAPGTYASAFTDVVDGTNGTCALCSAGTGFDTATGWGTPNVATLLPMLTGVSSAQATVPVTPTVPGGAFTGRNAVALTQSLGVTQPANVTTTFALTGAPAGLTVDTSGTLHWTSPVTGSYSFTAKATTSAGAAAAATYTLKVIPYTAPVFTGANAFSGKVGVAFSGALAATNPNTGTLTYRTSGTPAGMTTSSAGAMAWAAPVAGNYTFAATVTDSYGLTSSKTYTLAIAAATATVNHAPTLPSMSIVAKTTTALSVTLRGHDADGDAMTYSMTGAPAGATLSSAGVLAWSHPTDGAHPITVTVHDSHGATSTAVITLMVS